MFVSATSPYWMSRANVPVFLSFTLGMCAMMSVQVVLLQGMIEGPTIICIRDGPLACGRVSVKNSHFKNKSSQRELNVTESLQSYLLLTPGGAIITRLKIGKRCARFYVRSVFFQKFASFTNRFVVRLTDMVSSLYGHRVVDTPNTTVSTIRLKNQEYSGVSYLPCLKEHSVRHGINPVHLMIIYLALFLRSIFTQTSYTQEIRNF